MDPLSTAAALLSIVSLASRVIGKQFLEATEVLIDNYGPIAGVALAFYFGSTAPQYLRIQRSVLNGKDEDAVQFRQAVVNECNMTAIAVSTFLSTFVVTCSVSAQGAIIAQVAITGLSLPSLSSTHWLARAFLLLAVISGCLSVYYACVLQRAIGKLYRPSHIRDWLRLPPPSGDGETDVRRASLMAVLIVSAPFTMVKVSIFSFLIGLTIYQGYIWTRALDSAAGTGASRDVFITLVVGLGFCVIYFEIAFAAKDIETLMRTGRTKVEEEEEAQMPHQNGDTAVSPRTLAEALDAAARAHAECAEADRRVAQLLPLTFPIHANESSSGAVNESSGGACELIREVSLA